MSIETGGKTSLSNRQSLRSSSFGEPSLKHKSRCRLYVIEEVETGRLKFGISNNPQRRLKTLQTGNTSSLRLLGHIEGGQELEARIHAFLAKYHQRGEWFVPEIEVLLFADALLREGAFPSSCLL